MKLYMSTQKNTKKNKKQMNKELDWHKRFNNMINVRSNWNRKLSLMRSDTQQIIDNTGSHIIRMQFRIKKVKI